MDKVFFYFLVLFPAVFMAQTKDQVIAGTVSKYNTADALQFTTTYNLYKSATDKVVTESYSGFYAKNGQNFYLKINDTEFISSAKYGVKINHSERLMAISVAKSGGGVATNEFLNVVKDFKAGKFKDHGAYWEIEMLAPPFSAYPYSRIIMQIGKDYYIKKQEFYFSTGMNASRNFKQTEIVRPKLEVLFSKVLHKITSPEVFNTARFFSGADKDLKPVPKYRHYKIVYAN